MFLRALLNYLLKIRGSGNFVNQTPAFCAFTFDAVGVGAEKIGEIAADFTFVDDAGEATGAGENAEQRSFGKADGARAIVDQNNFVTGEGKFVAAAGGGAVERGEKFQAVVAG